LLPTVPIVHCKGRVFVALEAIRRIVHRKIPAALSLILKRAAEVKGEARTRTPQIAKPDAAGPKML
jgi:hypothetical protein